MSFFFPSRIEDEKGDDKNPFFPLFRSSLRRLANLSAPVVPSINRKE
jgi:hypothetical protein